MDLHLQPATTPMHANYACRLTLNNMRRYYRRHRLQFMEENWRRSWQTLENFLLLDNYTLLGYLSIDVAGEYLFLRDMQVEANWRRQGIGSWALAQLQRLAEQRALHAIRLKVFFDNPAQELYRRLGFVTVGRQDYLLLMEYRLGEDRQAPIS